MYYIYIYIYIYIQIYTYVASWHHRFRWAVAFDWSSWHDNWRGKRDSVLNHETCGMKLFMKKYTTVDGSEIRLTS